MQLRQLFCCVCMFCRVKLALGDTYQVSDLGEIMRGSDCGHNEALLFSQLNKTYLKSSFVLFPQL